MARRHEKLEEAVSLLQGYDHFVRPHSALPHSKRQNMDAPAIQAELVTRRLTLLDVFLSFGPRARLPWLVNPEARHEWKRDLGCVPSNS